MTTETTLHTDALLVAVDGSDSSRQALRWAEALGLPMRAAQAWSYPGSIPLPWASISTHTPEQVDREVQTQLANLVAEELGERGGGNEVPAVVLRGPAAPALLAEIETTLPRAVVVGSRGRGGFVGLLLGSVSRHLVEHAARPVIVVPARERAVADPGVRSIVVGLDDSDAAREALEFAVRLAADTGARVTAVHALDIGRVGAGPERALEVRNQIESALEHWTDVAGPDMIIERRILDGDPRTSIPVAARDLDADLVVVGAVGAGTVRSELGPVASHLVTHAPVPVAVVR